MREIEIPKNFKELMKCIDDFKVVNKTDSSNKYFQENCEKLFKLSNQPLKLNPNQELQLKLLVLEKLNEIMCKDVTLTNQAFYPLEWDDNVGDSDGIFSKKVEEMQSNVDVNFDNNILSKIANTLNVINKLKCDEVSQQLKIAEEHADKLGKSGDHQRKNEMLDRIAKVKELNKARLSRKHDEFKVHQNTQQRQESFRNNCLKILIPEGKKDILKDHQGWRKFTATLGNYALAPVGVFVGGVKALVSNKKFDWKLFSTNTESQTKIEGISDSISKQDDAEHKHSPK